MLCGIFSLICAKIDIEQATQPIPHHNVDMQRKNCPKHADFIMLNQNYHNCFANTYSSHCHFGHVMCLTVPIHLRVCIY